MLPLMLWLAFQTRLEVSQIKEMGCTGQECVTLEQLAEMPTGRLPEGCELRTQEVKGSVIGKVPLLVCTDAPTSTETIARPAAAAQAKPAAPAAPNAKAAARERKRRERK